MSDLKTADIERALAKDRENMARALAAVLQVDKADWATARAAKSHRHPAHAARTVHSTYHIRPDHSTAPKKLGSRTLRICGIETGSARCA